MLRAYVYDLKLILLLVNITFTEFLMKIVILYTDHYKNYY